MFRICIVLLLTIPTFTIRTAHAADSEGVLKLKTLREKHGEEYAKALKEFWITPGAQETLEQAVSRDKADWLAAALLLHFKNPALRTLIYESTASFLDVFNRNDNCHESAILDWVAVNKLSWFSLSASNGYVQKYIRNFDYHDMWALELEELVCNPLGLSPGARFWLLSRALAFIPLDKPDVDYWLRMNPSKLEAEHAHTFDLALNANRLRSVLLSDAEPFIKLPIAAKLKGQDAENVLKALSREDSFLGALSALLFAGRFSYPKAMAHPFNGEWLEEWAKSATPGQLSGIDALFAKKYVRPERVGLSIDAPSNRTFEIPDGVAGLFLKYHKNRLSDRFAEKYQGVIRNDIADFMSNMKDYSIKDDPEGYGLKMARDDAKLSMVWPRETLAELAAIKTTDAKAKALLEKVKTNVRNRTGDYPTGKDLQAAFGQ